GVSGVRARTGLRGGSSELATDGPGPGSAERSAEGSTEASARCSMTLPSPAPQQARRTAAMSPMGRSLVSRSPASRSPELYPQFRTHARLAPEFSHNDHELWITPLCGGTVSSSTLTAHSVDTHCSPALGSS